MSHTLIAFIALFLALFTSAIFWNLYRFCNRIDHEELFSET